MCTCDFEGPEVCTETRPVARKQHVCFECGSAIDPGEKYWRLDGMWYKFETYKMCEICRQIADLAYKGGHDCIPFGCLYEIVGNDYEDAVVL